LGVILELWWNSLRNSFKEVFLLERIRKDRKNSLEQFFVGTILGLWLLWTDSKVDIGILFVQFDDIRNPLFVAAILIGFLWYGVYRWAEKRQSFYGWIVYDHLRSLFSLLVSTTKNAAVTAVGTIFVCSFNEYRILEALPMMFILLLIANGMQKSLDEM